MQAPHRLNEAVTKPHVIDDSHAQPNGKQSHNMGPPRRETPPLRDDSSREILDALCELTEAVKESKPKTQGVPITYVLSILVPVVLAAMFLADMHATLRSQTQAIIRHDSDNRILMEDLDSLMAYIVDTRFRLGQRGFELPDPPQLKSKRKEQNK
jgi:hypothetical protein